MNLRMLSYPAEIARAPMEVENMLPRMEFNIYVSCEFITMVMPEPTVASFKPVDFCRPEVIEPDFGKHVSLDECAFFKTFSAEDETTLYVPEKEIWTVEKHLAQVKEMMRPKQKELREK